VGPQLFKLSFFISSLAKEADIFLLVLFCFVLDKAKVYRSGSAWVVE
jgi:hypothetical protein